MIKQIKFNLFIDNKPVHTIGELKENFNFSDLLEYFKSGILRKWLLARDLQDYITKLDNIKSDDDLVIAEELVKIFFDDGNNTLTEDEIKEAVYPIIYERKKKNDLVAFEEKNFSRKQIIDSYHKEYDEIINLIKEKKEDYPFIKSSIQRIYSDYLGIFKFHVEAFYFNDMANYPLAILAVLANKDMRNYFLNNEKIVENLKNYLKVEYNRKNEFDKMIIDFDSAEHQLGLSRALANIGHFLSDEKLVEKVKDYLKAKYNKKNEVDKIIDYYFGDAPLTLSSVFANLSHFPSHEELVETVKDYLKAKYNKKNEVDKIIINNNKSDEFNYVFNYIKIYGKATQQYWFDLENKGKEFMIIHIDSGSFVRNFGKISEQLGSDEVNNKFPILDGINYMSNDENCKLIYMEV
ncbi:MAG: hypothetical protein QXZ59_05425 [Nitrososphaeria archaeon]